MAFILHLPLEISGYMNNIEVVDRFTKLAHVIVITMMDTERTAKTFVKAI